MKTQIRPPDRRDAAGSASPVERYRNGGVILPLITAAMLCATGLVARADPFAPAPFPLGVGDRWTYVAEGGRRAEVQVSDSFQNGDKTVYRVEGYLFTFSTADVLFFDEQGMTAEMNVERQGEQVPAESGIWYPWSDLGRRVQIPAFAADCIHGTGGAILTDDVVSVPAGQFMNVITIRYDTHPCADQDLVSETFAPGIGLVSRTVRTFAGEERWALASATIDGQLIGNVNEAGAEARRSGAPTAAATPATWGSVKAVFAH